MHPATVSDTSSVSTTTDPATLAHSFADANLGRIESLVGADPGVFALACDSFLEGLAVHLGAPAGEGVSFRDKLDHLLYVTGAGSPALRELRSLARQFRDFRRHTNGVRHRFTALDTEEVIAVQERFRRFLTASGFSHPVIARLAEAVEEAWADRTPRTQYRRELRALRLEANRARSDNRSLRERIADFETAQANYDQAAGELARLSARVSELEARKGSDRSRIDELRQQLFQATERARSTARELEQEQPTAAYVEYLARATTLTRTRSDYERSVLNLSPEQEQIVAAIGERGDYLVRGPAGTGKTLVLMHAVQRERERIQAELGFDDHAQLGIFTFNKSLARFNRYLATILGTDATELTIQHADALIEAHAADCGLEVVHARKELQEWYGSSPTVLPADQLVTEVEEFILANDLTREQYVDEVIPRRGLASPLRREQRSEVWAAAEAAWQRMQADGRVSKQRAVQILLRRAEEDETWRQQRQFRRIFLDEAQDLTAVELAYFATLSRNGTIICGDEQQRLYRFGGSFSRSGIAIRNRSRTLRTNYRNTVEICAFSEEYRQRVSGIDVSEHGEGTAFRHGPEPEIYISADADAMWALVVDRLQFFTEQLGYEPEQIALLAPTRKFLGKAQRLLEAAGLGTCSVLEEDFDFEHAEGVRLSTLHSAKGLEFPVVFLLLPLVLQDRSVEEDEAVIRLRNLIYVSLTRAMDNLQIFATESGREKNAVVGEVVALTRHGQTIP